MLWKSLILFATLCAIRASYVPSWESLQLMLHEKLEDIYQSDKTEVYKKIHAGKYFKYYLSTEPGTYQAYEEGSLTLPHWLTYDEKKKKLQGIPLLSDVRKGLRITFTSTHKTAKKVTKTLILDIISDAESFHCKDTATVASLIFHSDLKSMNIHHQVRFLRHLSHELDTSIHNLHLQRGNRMDDNGLLNAHIRMAGPGDRSIIGNQPGFTVTWKLKCGTDVSGHPDIAMLRDYSQKEDFSKFGKPVLGWFVTSEKSIRNRRAIGLSGTPGITPTVSVQGTPTLIPSAGGDVKSSVSLSVTPSKSVPPMMKTSAMTTLPPLTTETPETTEKPTTRKPVTRRPTIKTTPTSDNATPEIRDQFKFPDDKIVVVENSPKIEDVHAELFGDPKKLSVKLLYKRKDYKYDVPSWITYRDVDSNGNPERKLYIFPGEIEAQERHEFALEANNSVALNRYFFRVVVDKERVVYKFKFNTTIDVNYNEYANNVRKRLKLLERLTRALYKDDSNALTKLRDVSFSQGSLVVAWSDFEFKNISCNSPDLVSYKGDLENDRFREAMSPEYPIKSTGVMAPSDCEVLNTEPAPQADDDDSLWERILIPVIVIVVILLIIILILCCVYRRKHSYETGTDETYLNHKKPVIFLEEFQEKPGFVSLEPLILPNEKPPVTDQAYAPRGGSPDGPESSTSASSENDESTPLAPNSPKDTRTGFNAPPPYSAR